MSDLDFSSYIQPFPCSRRSSGCVDILRLDQNDLWLSGNKQLKLAGWMDVFQASDYQALLSFGGVHSNHLHALACLAARYHIPAIFMVRGFAHMPLTATLRDCRHLGADLHFLDRVAYARRYDTQWQQTLSRDYQALVIPEGGSGEPGLRYCRSLAAVASLYDEVWIAVGSGATALGLAQGLAALGSRTLLVGVNVVADQGERQRLWQEQMPAGGRWELLAGDQSGGFGRITPELLALIRTYDDLGLPLDPVYTARLVQMYERAARPDRRTLLIHTGGLQGRRGAGLDWQAPPVASLLAGSVV